MVVVILIEAEDEVNQGEQTAMITTVLVTVITIAVVDVVAATIIVTPTGGIRKVIAAAMMIYLDLPCFFMVSF